MANVVIPNRSSKLILPTRLTGKLIVPRMSVPDVGFPFDNLANAPLHLYSLRRGLTSYTGSLIRLRRDSDNAEMDFGYDGNGDLDQGSITTWAGGANVETVTWYDQVPSGAIDYAQSTATRQPTLISGELDFDGSDSLDKAQVIALPHSVYLSVRSDSKAGSNVYWSVTGGSGYSIGYTQVTTGYMRLDQTGGTGIRSSTSQVDWVDGSFHLSENINIGQNTLTTRIDGGSVGVITSSTGNLVTSTTMKIGAYLTALHHTGKITEVVEFGVDMTAHNSDRNIVGNASEHWGVSYTDI